MNRCEKAINLVLSQLVAVLLFGAGIWQFISADEKSARAQRHIAEVEQLQELIRLNFLRIEDIPSEFPTEISTKIKTAAIPNAWTAGILFLMALFAQMMVLWYALAATRDES